MGGTFGVSFKAMDRDFQRVNLQNIVCSKQSQGLIEEAGMGLGVATCPALKGIATILRV
ncbi:MAG: hypothetical protein N2327_00420 [Caldimicrobium sp.]|nr:hypothetical protein [Caldimicrobium sp.]